MIPSYARPIEKKSERKAERLPNNSPASSSSTSRTIRVAKEGGSLNRGPAAVASAHANVRGAQHANADNAAAMSEMHKSLLTHYRGGEQSSHRLGHNDDEVAEEEKEDRRRYSGAAAPAMMDEDREHRPFSKHPSRHRSPSSARSASRGGDANHTAMVTRGGAGGGKGNSSNNNAPPPIPLTKPLSSIDASAGLLSHSFGMPISERYYAYTGGGGGGGGNATPMHSSMTSATPLKAHVINRLNHTASPNRAFSPYRGVGTGDGVGAVGVFNGPPSPHRYRSPLGRRKDDKTATPVVAASRSSRNQSARKQRRSASPSSSNYQLHQQPLTPNTPLTAPMLHAVGGTAYSTKPATAATLFTTLHHEYNRSQNGSVGTGNSVTVPPSLPSTTNHKAKAKGSGRSAHSASSFSAAPPTVKPPAVPLLAPTPATIPTSHAVHRGSALSASSSYYVTSPGHDELTFRRGKGLGAIDANTCFYFDARASRQTARHRDTIPLPKCWLCDVPQRALGWGMGMPAILKACKRAGEIIKDSSSAQDEFSSSSSDSDDGDGNDAFPLAPLSLLTLCPMCCEGVSLGADATSADVVNKGQDTFACRSRSVPFIGFLREYKLLLEVLGMEVEAVMGADNDDAEVENASHYNDRNSSRDFTRRIAVHKEGGYTAQLLKQKSKPPVQQQQNSSSLAAASRRQHHNKNMNTNNNTSRRAVAAAGSGLRLPKALLVPILQQLLHAVIDTLQVVSKASERIIILDELAYLDPSLGSVVRDEIAGLLKAAAGEGGGGGGGSSQPSGGAQLIQQHTPHDATLLLNGGHGSASPTGGNKSSLLFNHSIGLSTIAPSTPKTTRGQQQQYTPSASSLDKSAALKLQYATLVGEPSGNGRSTTPGGGGGARPIPPPSSSSSSLPRSSSVGLVRNTSPSPAPAASLSPPSSQPLALDMGAKKSSSSSEVVNAATDDNNGPSLTYAQLKAKNEVLEKQLQKATAMVGQHAKKMDALETTKAALATQVFDLKASLSALKEEAAAGKKEKENEGGNAAAAAYAEDLENKNRRLSEERRRLLDEIDALKKMAGNNATTTASKRSPSPASDSNHSKMALDAHLLLTNYILKEASGTMLTAMHKKYKLLYQEASKALSLYTRGLVDNRRVAEALEDMGQSLVEERRQLREDAERLAAKEKAILQKEADLNEREERALAAVQRREVEEATMVKKEETLRRMHSNNDEKKRSSSSADKSPPILQRYSSKAASIEREDDEDERRERERSADDSDEGSSQRWDVSLSPASPPNPPPPTSASKDARPSPSVSAPAAASVLSPLTPSPPHHNDDGDADNAAVQSKANATEKEGVKGTRGGGGGGSADEDFFGSPIGRRVVAGVGEGGSADNKLSRDGTAAVAESNAVKRSGSGSSHHTAAAAAAQNYDNADAANLNASPHPSHHPSRSPSFYSAHSPNATGGYRMGGSGGSFCGGGGGGHSQQQQQQVVEVTTITRKTSNTVLLYDKALALEAVKQHHQRAAATADEENDEGEKGEETFGQKKAQQHRQRTTQSEKGAVDKRETAVRGGGRHIDEEESTASFFTSPQKRRDGGKGGGGSLKEASRSPQSSTLAPHHHRHDEVASERHQQQEQQHASANGHAAVNTSSVLGSEVLSSLGDEDDDDEADEEEREKKGEHEESEARSAAAFANHNAGEHGERLRPSSSSPSTSGGRFNHADSYHQHQTAAAQHYDPFHPPRYRGAGPASFLASSSQLGSGTRAAAMLMMMNTHANVHSPHADDLANGDGHFYGDDGDAYSDYGDEDFLGAETQRVAGQDEFADDDEDGYFDESTHAEEGSLFSPGGGR